MKYLLGVDLGTSGTKTVLFDEMAGLSRILSIGTMLLSTQSRLS